MYEHKKKAKVVNKIIRHIKEKVKLTKVILSY